MTFEEWKEQNLNRFTCSHEVFVAYEAWQQQQKRIDELEKMSNGRDEVIEELREELKESQQKHLDSIRALRTANEQIINIAKDNGQLRTEIESYQEPVPDECEQVVYVATHNIEEDTFYVGSLREIMEWCEDWNHGISSLNFFRLGDEVRVGFVDMGKDTRFGGK